MVKHASVDYIGTWVLEIHRPTRICGMRGIVVFEITMVYNESILLVIIGNINCTSLGSSIILKIAIRNIYTIFLINVQRTSLSNCRVIMSTCRVINKTAVIDFCIVV